MRPFSLRRRAGQSTVESMILMPLLALVIVALYQLWSVAWAAQNAHLRAREQVLHGDAYLGGRPGDVSGSAPFSGNNYEKAESTTFRFESQATDETVPGVGRGQSIRTKAVITSR